MLNAAATSSTTLTPLPRHNHRRITSLHNPIKTLTRLVWGPSSLPPTPLISTARTLWSHTWHLFMSQLAPSDSSGNYTRPNSQFLGPATSSFSSLHLYAAHPCPWAHRVLIVRSLLGLEAQIPVSIASPGPNGGWVFEGEGSDGAHGKGTLREVYGMRRGGYKGRATVPLLWDKGRLEVVCNESWDIIVWLNRELGDGIELAPRELMGRIEEWNRVIYPNVNNGVYRCGFAQSQEAYDSAVNDLFGTLDMLEEHLGGSQFLCGDVLTLADVCLFTTLIRFDLVYNVLFKCTKKKLLEYPNLYGYTRDIYQIPKVAETCNFEAIMDGYYKILFPLNPGGIRPIMPAGCGHEALSRGHNRESLSSSEKRLEASLLK
ncbi:Glutathionyl-hydroquinone reductase YqjG-like protein [Drosera capensis]